MMSIQKHALGFRYYRPKPYLLITPAGDEVTLTDPAKKSPTKTTKIKSDQFVSIELEYLPDFSEEYAIDIRNRFGTSNVTMTLEDGWKLTSLNQQLDAQVDENLTAVAELVKAGGSVIATGTDLRAAEKTNDPPGTRKRWVVQATNIPLGYYESVIGRLPNGKKQMFGWRYVGFAPFNSCPTDMSGVTSACCENDARGPVYGLAFEQGVMVFRALGQLERSPDDHFYMVPVQFGEIEPIAVDTGSDRRLTKDELKDYINNHKDVKQKSGVDITVSAVEIKADGRINIQLATPVEGPIESKIEEIVAEKMKTEKNNVTILPSNPGVSATLDLRSY